MFRILDNYNKKQLKKMNKLVTKINDFNFSDLTDKELQMKTIFFKEQLANGKKLNDILPEAFATVKESSKRILGKEHHNVQLIGGIVLHFGNVAEMKTGEGKTLVGALPSYLNALDGKSIHIVTVNEYLAKRDFEELSPLYSFLGLSSACIYSEMTPEEKKKAYNANIVFGTNNEFGFDYLRDNLAKSLEQRVQSPLHFAIVDEVDSILIDESRTPLVLSGPSSENSNLLNSTDVLVSNFKKGIQFDIDKESEQVFLTEEGISQTENFFSIENLYAPKNSKINHFVNQSLKAYASMKKDKDYIVMNDEVHIIDPFTGRMSPGRRYSNNLHQAIEVKEKVPMKEETTTKATITYQNYFRLYGKLAGMTGTAETEKDELRQIYGMETIVIPTNKPVLRVDESNLVFATKEEKKQSIVKKVKELHEKQQPVLLGTSSIEESEIFSKAFSNFNIPHVLLNAKNHESEAEIVSLAGQKNAVTIATNMAGRGTDIKLGEGVREIGGLYIIGTSLNENRRVDNQLRGRSGRQGDPGFSQFYVSLEDELMERFGASKMKETMTNMNLMEGEGISSKFLTKIFSNAQKRLEGANYDVRKNLLKYDDVLREQREIIYNERLVLLKEENLLEITYKMIYSFINNNASKSLLTNEETQEWHDLIFYPDLAEKLQNSFTPFTFKRGDGKNEIIDFYTSSIKEEINRKFSTLPDVISNELIKNIMLNNLDILWEEHLELLSEIRQGIHFYAYSQTDPLREYQFKAMETFEQMLDIFKREVIKQLLLVEINIEVQKEY